MTRSSVDAGVYTAQQDTWLLSEALAEALAALPDPVPSCRILEIGTGTGALAVQAAARPGTRVTAIDVSEAALRSAGDAARDAGVAVRLMLGDLTAPVRGERFDLVVSNPPYVPAPEAGVPSSGPSRAWDAGHDGRAVLDRLCREVPRVLAPAGCLLLVHSALSDVGRTRTQLDDAGLTTAVAARRTHPFGPVLCSRTDYLEHMGLIGPGCRNEELVVIRAHA
jgi:release factor glutamine methyltransferase